MRAHLFVAMSNFAFGEVSLALRLAWQLHARGDRVVFLAPSGLAMLFAGTPFKYGQTDAAWNVMDSVIVEVLAEHRCVSLTLVDAASVFLAFDVAGIDARFLAHLSVPVVALDVWSLPETDLRWDTGGELWHVPPAAAQFARRLCPVPFIRPVRAPGHYNALPQTALDPAEREAARRELGVGAEDRVILTTTGAWQTRRATTDAYQRHLLDVVPPLVAGQLARVDARVLHVGPEPFATADRALGARYRWHERVPPPQMRAFMAAADAVLTLNVSATTIQTAMVLGVPVIVLTSSFGAATAPPHLRSRHAELAPFGPFQLWPLGLARFLAPVLRDNPYVDAIARVEITDDDAVVSACRRLTGDRDARAEARARAAAYLAQVAELPGVLEVFDAYL